MKKAFIIALALLAGASFSTIEAGNKKKKKAEAPVAEPVKPALAPVSLRSGSDTLSYAAGISFTNGLTEYLKQQGIDSTLTDDFVRGFSDLMLKKDDPKAKAYAIGIDIANQLSQRMLPAMLSEFTDTPEQIVDTLFFRGFIDGIKGDGTIYNLQQAENVFREKQALNKQAKEERLYGANRAAGEKFLAENAKQPDVIQTPSGLQYKVLVKGEGEVPQVTDKVLVHYEGRLVDGTVFDASKNHGDQPASFRADQVIKGWTEALTMMPVGSKWQLFIPYQLAYGNREAGQIKPFSALIFDVELIGIDKPQPKQQPSKPQPKKSAKNKKRK